MTNFQKFSDNFPKIYGQAHNDCTIKVLSTNCSFHTENIRTLVFCTDLISFGGDVKTEVQYVSVWTLQ